MEDAPDRLLIIDTAWLGDVVFTTALAAAVREVWPRCEIHLVVSPRGADVVADHPFFRKLWVFDKGGNQRSIGAMRSLAQRLRGEKFDVTLNAHPSFRSRVLTRWIASPTSVGYRGFLSASCFTHVVDGGLAREPDHVRRRLELLRPLAGRVTEASPWIHVTDADREAAREQLHRVDSTKPVLGLAIGSAWNTKCWSIENFRNVVARWLEESDGDVIVFGGNRETENARLIAELNLTRIHTVIKRPMQLVRALIERCTIFVGNDTGLTFLAVAVNSPAVIALYGSTQTNFDFRAPHVALQAGVPCCASRYGHGKPSCRWQEGNAWCMSQISPDSVWSIIEEKLPLKTQTVS